MLRASHELSGNAGQQSVDVHSLIGVNVDQFYGIEIEEFAAQIAQVALWLVDHQMNLRVSEEFGLYFARIPLKTSPHISMAMRSRWIGRRCCRCSAAVMCWAIRRLWAKRSSRRSRKPTSSR